jgi:hypothetical protein
MVYWDSKPKGNPIYIVIKCKRGGKYQFYGKDSFIALNKQYKELKLFKSNCSYYIILKRGTLLKL